MYSLNILRICFSFRSANVCLEGVFDLIPDRFSFSFPFFKPGNIAAAEVFFPHCKVYLPQGFIRCAGEQEVFDAGFVDSQGIARQPLALGQLIPDITV